MQNPFTSCVVAVAVYSTFLSRVAEQNTPVQTNFGVEMYLQFLNDQCLGTETVESP